MTMNVANRYSLVPFRKDRLNAETVLFMLYISRLSRVETCLIRCAYFGRGLYDSGIRLTLSKA